MLESYIYLSIELGICSIIILFLLIYYVRRNINKLVFIIAYIVWFFNCALIIFVPFDIYYTLIKVENEMPQITKYMINYGYSITYWTLFIFSWIILPLMQSYESSGEFTKFEKLKSSLRRNLIYYSILLAISIFILIFSIINYGVDKTLVLAKNCSLIFGIVFFFFLLSYSLIKYPKTLYQKLQYINQIKYHEWRANQFYEKLDEINYDIVNRLLRLKVTIKKIKEMNDEDDNDNDNDNDKRKASVDSRPISGSLSLDSSLIEKPKQIKDYLNNMIQIYNDFSNDSSIYGIKLEKEKIDKQKPIKNLKDLIELNRKLNKKKNDNLRMQCRLRNCYSRWVILNTLLYFGKIKDNTNDNENEKKDNSKKVNEEEDKEINEKIIIKTGKKISLKDEGFIPLEGFTNCKIIYYSKLKKVFLFFLFILSIIGAIITVFCEILMLFKRKLIFKILVRIENIFILHFFILIPFIYLICMSNYTLFKIKVSSYIYMYGHRQTDSVSLMIFSPYLSRIYFAICLNCLQAINQFSYEDRRSKFEEFFNIKHEEDNYIIYLCRLSPILLILFMILFFFNVPGKIGNCVGFNLFEFESEEINI